MIAKNFLDLCADDWKPFTPAFWAAHHGNLEMLRYMADAILLFFSGFNNSKETSGNRDCWTRERVLRDTFERGSERGWNSAHSAAYKNHIDCLAFLVEHAPSGTAILEKMSSDGLPVHCAAYFGSTDVLDFAVRNTQAPTGITLPLPMHRFPRTRIPGSVLLLWITQESRISSSSTLLLRSSCLTP